MSTILKKALNNAYEYYNVTNEHEMQECPKVTFNDNSDLSRVVSSLISGVNEYTIRKEAFHDVTNKINNNLNDDHNATHYGLLDNLGTGFASTLIDAITTYQSVILPESDNLVKDIIDTYNSKLTIDGNEKIINHNQEPSTDHIRLLTWDGVTDKVKRDILFDSLYETVGLKSKEVSDSGLLVIQNKVKFLLKDFKPVNLNQDGLDIFTQECVNRYNFKKNINVAEVENKVKVLTNQNEFTRYTNNIINELSVKFNNLGNKISFLIDEAEVLKHFEDIKNISDIENMSDEHMNSIHNNVDKLMLLRQAMIYCLYLFKNTRCKDVLMYSSNIVDNNEFNKIKKENKKLVDLVKYDRMIDGVPITGVPTSLFLSEKTTISTENYDKRISLKADSIESSTTNYAYSTTLTKAVERIATLLNEDCDGKFRERWNQYIESHKYLNRGKIINIDKVVLDLLIDFGYKGTMIEQIYTKFNNSFQHLLENNQESIDVEDTRLAEINAITEIVGSYLIDNFCTIKK